MAESCIGTRLRSKRCVHEVLAETLRAISLGECRATQIVCSAELSFGCFNVILQKLYDAKLVNVKDMGAYNLFEITEKGEFYLAIAEEFIAESNKIIGKVKR